MSGSKRVAGDATYGLPHNTEAAAVARRYLAEHGAQLAPDLLADAQLLVSEIVANAVLHGRPAITLRLRVDPPEVGVAVADGGGLLPSSTPVAAGPDARSGRGMFIVDSLASAWGVESAPDGGKTVWFELRE